MLSWHPGFPLLFGYPSVNFSSRSGSRLGGVRCFHTLMLLSVSTSDYYSKVVIRGVSSVSCYGFPPVVGHA
jgi:hypothetical protein